jgi:hypothetical protein
MKLTCYALNEFAPKLIAARPQRQWMDEFGDRHPYRCLPLSIANAHGWEALCPGPIEIEWNGGPSVDDLVVRALKPLPGDQPVDHFCRSNFARGIATFHLDYLFRTDPGWDLLATGPFNRPKDNAAPLTGIIETDWLPYPFTMNWQLLRPGRILFEEDEPFCFIFPIPKQALLDCQPEIRALSEDSELSRQHEEFRLARDSFMQKFNAGDAETIRQAWQRYYFVGRHPDGTEAAGHLNKLRLKEPVDRREKPPFKLAPAWHATVALASDTGFAPPKWHADSPLNAIDHARSERNDRGARRIDPEGCIADWRGVRVVRQSEDADFCDFVVVDDLLRNAECERLCRAFHEMANRVFSSDDIDPYWNNRFIWFADIAAARPADGEIMLGAQRRATELMRQFYQVTAPLYADLLQIVKWGAGMFMPPHADNRNPDGSHHHMSHREFAGVVYLNDDYEGGELYFTALDVAIKPKRGMFVGMTGGFHHEHAVLRVHSGTRLTMPFFLTFNPAHADRGLIQDKEAGRQPSISLQSSG